VCNEIEKHNVPSSLSTFSGGAYLPTTALAWAWPTNQPSHRSLCVLLLRMQTAPIPVLLWPRTRHHKALAIHGEE